MEEAGFAGQFGESNGHDSSSILEMVLRRTIMRKDASVSYEGLPGLSRITPFTCLRQGGW